MVRQGRRDGCWYPQFLVDYLTAALRRVRVWRVSEPEWSDGGIVRTRPTVFDFAWGEYGHMPDRVQYHIDKKTTKDQMEWTQIRDPPQRGIEFTWPSRKIYSGPIRQLSSSSNLTATASVITTLS